MKTNEHGARVIGRDLPISTKQAIEICNFIRKKNLQKVKEILSRVIAMKTAIPFKKFKRDVGHKRGRIAAGRYPVKSAQYILKLLNALEISAQNKGLDPNSLFIKTIIANKASRPWHYGRQRRIKMKRTHVEIIAEEKEPAKKVEKEISKKKPTEKKEIPKKEEIKKPEKEIEEAPKEETEKEQKEETKEEKTKKWSKDNS